jgi:hypothetical protein
MTHLGIFFIILRSHPLTIQDIRFAGLNLDISSFLPFQWEHEIPCQRICNSIVFRLGGENFGPNINIGRKQENNSKITVFIAWETPMLQVEK